VGTAGFLIRIACPAVERFFLDRPPTCLLKLVLGIPCLACRGTRAAFALSHGDVPGAFAYNPLATLFLVGLPVALALGALSGHTVRVHGSPAEARLFWILLAAALLGNWLYVIHQGG